MSHSLADVALAAVLVAVCLSSPASAASADLTGNDTLDDAVDSTTDAVDSPTDAMDSTTDAVDSPTDAVDSTTDEVDGTVDATTDAASDGDLASGNDTVASGNLTVAVNGSTDGTVDATASTNGTLGAGSTASSGTLTVAANETSLRATADVSASAGGRSLDVTASSQLNGGTNATVEALLVPADGAAGGETPAAGTPTDAGAPTDAGPPDDADLAPTDGVSTGTDASGSSGAPLPGESTAVVGVALVGAAVAARSGLSAVGASPPLGLRPTASVTVDALRTRLPPFLPFGYSRHDDSDPLEHDVRADLYEVIETTPGVNLSALGDRTDASLSSVRHHLRILEAESLVETNLINGKRRYFPAGTDDAALIAALDDEAKAAVLRAVADREPASVSDLAATLDRDPSTVSHHLSQLAEAGLVERERAGQAVETRLAADVRPALNPAEGGRDGATAD